MNLFYFGTALNLSVLYMIAGCGSCVSLKAGQFNLGGEAQVYAGGFICAIFLSMQSVSKLPPVLAILLALLLSFMISGIISGISALLHQLKNADFLFTSFILSSAIIPLIDGLISGPFRSKTENLLATPFIPKNMHLPAILQPSPLNISIFFALLICVLFGYLIFRTPFGRKICILGISNQFAQYSTYDCKTLHYESAFISGGMHGICGAVTILGTYFTCHSGFYSGLGWNALSAALIARSNPLLLIPSSIFLAFITTFSNKYALYNSYSFDMSGILQASILLLISFPLFSNQKQREL